MSFVAALLLVSQSGCTVAFLSVGARMDRTYSARAEEALASRQPKEGAAVTVVLDDAATLTGRWRGVDVVGADTVAVIERPRHIAHIPLRQIRGVRPVYGGFGTAGLLLGVATDLLLLPVVAYGVYLVAVGGL